MNVQATYGACNPDHTAPSTWLVQDLDQLLPCIRFPLMLDGELEAVRWVLAGRELGAAVQAVAGGPLGR